MTILYISNDTKVLTFGLITNDTKWRLFLSFVFWEESPTRPTGAGSAPNLNSTCVARLVIMFYGALIKKNYV